MNKFKLFLVVIFFVMGLIPSSHSKAQDSGWCEMRHDERYDNGGHLTWDNRGGIEHVHFLRVYKDGAPNLAPNLPSFQIYYGDNWIGLDVAGSDGATYTDFYIPTHIAAESSAGWGPLWSDDNSWTIFYQC